MFPIPKYLREENPIENNLAFIAYLLESGHFDGFVNDLK